MVGTRGPGYLYILTILSRLATITLDFNVGF